ncbi:MAG: guanylate kinase [Bacteroidetes bacterium]|nr:guanylate kinase [Bacteroidota bacterium]MDA0875159.1 guanylate kinase [Bacteroidota bacterium]
MSEQGDHSPCILIVAAPSGSGKSTLAARLMAALPQIRFSVSATTRPPRAGEEDGVAYHFLSADAFRAAVARGELLEYEEVYPDRFYGTLRSEVERSSVAHPVLLDVDVVGALNVKQEFGPRCLAVFVQAPSMEELERRLRARGTEDEATLQTRLDKAAWEMTFAPSFDRLVVNDDLDRAADELISHVRAFLAACP